ncbi:MAG: NUDIX hydrolase [Candidatus Paceibacterota bacterium]
MFVNKFSPGNESNQGGGSGTSASDSMIINWGNSKLKLVSGLSHCVVQDLKHEDGFNFATIYFIPQFIDGKTHLSTVINTDNKRGAPIRKIPGGTSIKGETIRQSISREMAEETGFVPTQVTFVDQRVLPSKEDKEAGHSDHTHFKILLWINDKKGAMLTRNMRDAENKKHEFVSIEDLIRDQNFNRGHKEFMMVWINFMVQMRADRKFPDLCKYI